MSTFCKSVPDTLAQEICQNLVTQHGFTQTRLDTGEDWLRFRRDRFVRDVTPPNGLTSPQELYGVAIRYAESNPIFWQFLRERLEVPWITHDIDPTTRDDEELRLWIVEKIAEIDQQLSASGLIRGEFNYQLRMAEGLFRAMVQPVEEGGLGLQFDSTQEGPQRNVIDIYRDRTATCVEFVVLYLMAADMAGIPAVPIELFEGSSGTLQEHLRIGIRHPKTGQVEAIADIQNGYFGRPLDNERWAVLSRLELLAYYHNLKAVREPDADRAESHVDRARRLNPNNYLILYNKAYFTALRGDLQAAYQYLLDSIAHYPRYSYAYWNLHIIAHKLGDATVSRVALEEFRRLIP